ncbi:TPM domain-containing protein [Acinetobacter sp. B10A]|uniref:TPM domain-containing protein n=1 Tax=Acinetobacter baretiae TaxID=2605383 RepID=UPI001B3CA48E|nr:TPM domain-containing protein [Acinetobacter baretiae]MBF7685051.1 TPM domain-containing protein [Acinetobacter baretiae]
MVNKRDTAHITTQIDTRDAVVPSFKRWFKHFTYIPNASKYFTKSDYRQITQAVQHAEDGHAGEIQVVVEGHIPCTLAYYTNTALRAQQLFAQLRVWDTELNSGILLYLNLCECRVEIVFDRGIRQKTTPDIWTVICENIVQRMKNKHYTEAVTQGVAEIGQVLNEYYAQMHDHDQYGNELSNRPIMI